MLKFILSPAAGSPTTTLLRLYLSPQFRIVTTKSNQQIAIYQLIIKVLQTKPIPNAWRAVCTELENNFTEACWSPITNDSSFKNSISEFYPNLKGF